MLDTVLHHRKNLKQFVKLGSNPNAIQHMYKGTLNVHVLRYDVIAYKLQCRILRDNQISGFIHFSLVKNQRRIQNPQHGAKRFQRKSALQTFVKWSQVQKNAMTRQSAPLL